MPESNVEHIIQLALPAPKKILTPAVTVLLLLMVAGYALGYYAAQFTTENLALNSQSILQGKVWILLTYPFVYFCGAGIFWDAIVVLFVGSSIEREWKTRALVVLWVIVCTVCGILWLLVNFLRQDNMIGCTAAPGYFGLLGVFGLLFRGKRFLFWIWTVEAQHIAWICIVAGLALNIRNLQSWIFVAGALVGYLYVKLRWRISAAATKKGARTTKATRARGFVDID